MEEPADFTGNVQPPSDPYLLLEIVGEAGGEELAGAIEPVLDWQSDPMVAMLALEILTTYWGLTPCYRDKIMEFMKGVAWDTERNVREVAISAAGESLRQRPDMGLLET